MNESEPLYEDQYPVGYRVLKVTENYKYEITLYAKDETTLNELIKNIGDAR